jgi:hypothetical protein
MFHFMVIATAYSRGDSGHAKIDSGTGKGCIQYAAGRLIEK